MATFSVNQVKQLYVVDADHTAEFKTTKDKDKVYLSYQGVDGPVRSDLVKVKLIEYANHTKAEEMERELPAYKIALDANVNGGDPIAGQDYILNIAFTQYVGMSDQDIYHKYGVVHATSTMTAVDFYEKLAESLEKNFSRELEKMVEFEVTTDGIIIRGVESEWRRGVKAQANPIFDVYTEEVLFDGDNVKWGTVKGNVARGQAKLDTTIKGNTVKNGKMIADMEYFYLGYRGDQYRQIKFPYNIETTYLVDPNKEYDTLDIHYSFVGSNESVQKSEKDITVVGEAADITALIATLKTAAPDVTVNERP